MPADSEIYYERSLIDVMITAESMKKYFHNAELMYTESYSQEVVKEEYILAHLEES